jgi:hypothetical protein
MSLRTSPRLTSAAPGGRLAVAGAVLSLRGLITEADLPAAEDEWPGLQAFLSAMPAEQRPPTFLELVWRFEAWRETSAAVRVQ